MAKVDWPVKTLGDICGVFDDGDWIESKDQATCGVRLIQTGNIGDGEFKDRLDKARFISESTFSRLRCTEVFPGDVLVSRLPEPVGRACLIPDTGSKMITAVDCTIMRTHNEIVLPQFLVLSTQTTDYREQVQAKITGTTRDRISRSNLAEVKVLVPPLGEQNRIVALLNDATARITELTACYERARTHANDLFTSALRDALECNPDWPVKTLGDICVVDWGNTNLTKKSYIENGKHLAVSAAGPDGRIGHAEHKAFTPVLSAIGARCGRMFLPKEDFTAVKNTITLTPRPDVATGQFIFSLFEYLKLPIRGAAQPFIAKGDIEKFEVAIPTLDEQQQIVVRLDQLRAKSSEMVAAYDAKLQAAKNLRQSILEAAFAGEL